MVNLELVDNFHNLKYHSKVHFFYLYHINTKVVIATNFEFLIIM